MTEKENSFMASRQKAQQLLEKISSKVHSFGTGDEGSQYSSMWKEFLEAKGVNYSLDNMLHMRALESVVTRGFGLDRRFSPSFDLYREEPLYQEILAIPESDFGDPEKLFYGLGQEKRSGIFLRNACYAYEIIRGLGRRQDEAFTILEIGPGFGMLAYILKNYFPKVKIVLVDLPESLRISAWYLENTLPGVSSLYLPADQGAAVDAATMVFINAAAFKQGIATYDLVINCDSMSEMTAAVALNYLKIIESDMKDRGMFFFLNKEGIDKEAMVWPTLYPFSKKWAVERIGPTYVGFLDDARHIQVSFRCSLKSGDQPGWRNRFLDLSYQYFYNNRLECFAMFECLQECARCDGGFDQGVETFLHQCLIELDFGYFLSSWEGLYARSDIKGSARSLLYLSIVMMADLLLENGRSRDVEPVARMLGKRAGSFAELWTAGRLLSSLDQWVEAEELWGRGIGQQAVYSHILFKAGVALAGMGRNSLAQHAWERVVRESPYALQRIEAATKLTMTLPMIDRLYAGLPEYIFSNGYSLVRLATIFLRNGYQERAKEVLQPIVTRKIDTGHYDLFAAVKMLDATADHVQVQELLQEAIKLGHNDNGFFRKVGLFFEQKGNIPLALEHLRRSVEIDVSWASTHYDLARIYRRLGQADLELAELRKADALSHNKEVDYDVLRQRLKVLEQTEVGGRLH